MNPLTPAVPTKKLSGSLSDALMNLPQAAMARVRQFKAIAAEPSLSISEQLHQDYQDWAELESLSPRRREPVTTLQARMALQWKDKRESVKRLMGDMGDESMPWALRKGAALALGDEDLRVQACSDLLMSADTLTRNLCLSVLLRDNSDGSYQVIDRFCQLMRKIGPSRLAQDQAPVKIFPRQLFSDILGEPDLNDARAMAWRFNLGDRQPYPLSWDLIREMVPYLKPWALGPVKDHIKGKLNTLLTERRFSEKQFQHNWRCWYGLLAEIDYQAATHYLESLMVNLRRYSHFKGSRVLWGYFVMGIEAWPHKLDVLLDQTTANADYSKRRPLDARISQVLSGAFLVRDQNPRIDEEMFLIFLNQPDAIRTHVYTVSRFLLVSQSTRAEEVLYTLIKHYASNFSKGSRSEQVKNAEGIRVLLQVAEKKASKRLFLKLDRIKVFRGADSDIRKIYLDARAVCFD